MRKAALALAMLTTASGAAAQTHSPGTAPNEPPTVRVSYEWHRERLRYQFENPSNIDTAFLVPHSYAQTYWLDNHWATISARYSLLGNGFSSEAGITPAVTGRASDIDTFFDPGDDVVTSGTDGDARLRSWRLAQWSEGRIGGVPLRLGYRYQRDTADFLPADIVLTHSRPPSTSRRYTTDQEFTSSQVHELMIDSSARLAESGGWRLRATIEFSPMVLGRLTTRLPQKYPGQSLISDTKAAAFSARADLERVVGRVPLVVGMTWGKTVSYEASRSLDRDALELSIGMAWW